MGENLAEDEATELLTTFRSNINDSHKIELLIHAKQKIKHYGVDNAAMEPAFAALRIGLSQSSNMTLFQHSLSCLGYLIKRCRANDSNLLKRLSADLIPLLFDKMGDAKDRIREMALAPVVDIWTVAPVETERYIRENGLTSKNTRLKESSLEWLVRVHAMYGGQLSIKPYTSLLVRLLEDASDSVREKTKNVVVDLFKSASDPAKADLKKLITEHQVRKTIANYIIENISPDMKSSARAEKEKSKEEKLGRQGAKDTFLNSIPGVTMEELRPAYINTGKELENEFAGMLADMMGKETEQNWAARERNVTRIRELLRGNAPNDHPVVFAAGIKTLADGIMNTVKSLRTTVASKSSQCVKDLFLVLGHGMDPTVDVILPTMIKLCGGTKKITAEAAHVACTIIFAKASYHHAKIPNYLYGACTDKNIQPRMYATFWFRALIEAHSHEKYVLEHGDGLKKLEDGLKKGLIDSNPGVREGARAAFWMYFDIWPDRATIILDAQDANTRKLLDKDNPNGAGAVASSSSSRPAATRAATGPARPSIKEQILARRKAEAAAAVPKLETSHSYPGPPSASSASSVNPPIPEKHGISSAPVRPVRPMRPKSQLSSRIDEAKRPASSSSNGDSVSAIEKTIERMNGSRAMSPVSARSGFSPSVSSQKKSSTTSPPGTTRQARPTIRQSPLSQRKMTILEQLGHPDHKIRLEGIVVLGCVLAGRTPPGYEKRPPIPGSDQLQPALQKLLNDPHAEVVESVLAPEVLPELIKFVGYDQIVPRVLLLNEGEESEHPRPYPTKSLASLKDSLAPEDAAELLFRVITSMGASGAMSRKILTGGTSFTSTQRRRIMHGALEWVNELLGSNGQIIPNEYLEAQDSFKLVINRMIPLVSTTKQPNFSLLAILLKNLQSRNPIVFDRTFATFDPSIQRELKKAWGMKYGDEDEERIEEEVAHVEKVLGIIPTIGDMAPPPRPNRGLEIPDVTQKINDDEELTMINPMSALAGIPLGSRPVTQPSTSQKEAKSSPNTSLEIPDLLGTTKKSNGASVTSEKGPIQVYQDPVPSILDFKPAKSPEPLANITNNIRPRAKNFGSSTTVGKTPEQQLRSLQNYMRKLKDADIDSHGLRRLCAIVRDNPAKKELQENKDAIDFWSGGQTFEDMLDALLDFLNDGSHGKSPEELADVRAQGVQLLRQLMLKATPYFATREHSVFPVSFKLRGEYPTQSPVSMNIEETIEAYVNTIADSGVAIPTIIGFLMVKSGVPEGLEGENKKKAGANVLALRTLGSFMKDAEDEDLTDQWGGLGAIAKKYMEDEDPEVRRAVVNVCVEMRRRFVKAAGGGLAGEEQGEEKLWRECLGGLSEGQRSLLTYYFARNS